MRNVQIITTTTKNRQHTKPQIQRSIINYNKTDDLFNSKTEFYNLC